MTDERLHQLYVEVLARRVPADRTACVAPEALLALVERRLPEDVRLRTLDHVMACAACRVEFELLRSLERGGRRLERRRFTPQALALAASLLILVGGGLVYRSLGGGGRRVAPEVMRGEEERVALIAPAGEVASGAARQLIWRAVRGAWRYDVEVLDTGGRLVFAATTADTVVTVPDSATLAAEAEYRWWVRAALRNATERRSQLQEFRIARP